MVTGIIGNLFIQLLHAYWILSIINLIILFSSFINNVYRIVTSFQHIMFYNLLIL